MTGKSPESHHWMNRVVEAFLEGNLSVLLILVSLICRGGGPGRDAARRRPADRGSHRRRSGQHAGRFGEGSGAAGRHPPGKAALPDRRRRIRLLDQLPVPGHRDRAVLRRARTASGAGSSSTTRSRRNIDQVPPGVTGWVVKPVEIDDVPIVNLTLYSRTYSDFDLRRMAEELEIRLQSVKNAGRTYLVGGRPREITVQLSPPRMAGRGVTLHDLQRAVQAAKCRCSGGRLWSTATRRSGSRPDVPRVGPRSREPGRRAFRTCGPCYLKEVADVKDGPAEPETYTRIAFGERPSELGTRTPSGEAAARHRAAPADYPAVTVGRGQAQGNQRGLGLGGSAEGGGAICQARSFPRASTCGSPAITARPPTRRSTNWSRPCRGHRHRAWPCSPTRWAGGKG